MQGRRDHRMKLICPVIPIRCGKLQNNPHICILFHHSVSIIPNIPLLLHVILSVPCHSERPSVILSDSEESVTSNRLFTQILHFVPLDLRSEREYGWNVYFCCMKETGQPTAR